MADIDVTLRDPATGQSVHLFPAPEEIPSGVRVIEREWRILNGGNVIRPNGIDPRDLALSGFLASADDAGEWFYPDDWQPPSTIDAQLEAWASSGTELHVTATNTPVDWAVTISSYDATWGELNRLKYDLRLKRVTAIMAETLSIREATARTDTGSATGAATANRRGALANRPKRSATSRPATHTIAAGESLVTLAQRYLGDATRWPDIYALNLAKIGSDHTRIPIGTVLALPEGARI